MTTRICGQAVRGPLAPYAEGFQTGLVGRGHGLSSRRLRLWQFDDVSRWIEATGLTPGEFTPERAEEYLAARRVRGYKTWLSPRSMRLIVDHLRNEGVVPAPSPVVAKGPVEALLDGYQKYLIGERGLAARTISAYKDIARLFLSEIADLDGLRMDQLSAADVTRFVGRECGHRSTSASKALVAAMRSLLRYLHVAGVTVMPLAPAVPAVARRRSSLPRGLTLAHAVQLLASCDRRRIVGRRDYAILILLVRLGLRAGEVSDLQLGDVDWRRGEMLVRGKGNRHERLPLPTDVGEALASYLRHGRPHGANRVFFLRVIAPSGRLSPRGISSVVHDACVRAGLPPGWGSPLAAHSRYCDVAGRCTAA